MKANFDIQKQVLLKISQQKSDNILTFQEMQEKIGLNSANLSPKINLNSINKIIEMILQHLMVKNQLQFLKDDEIVLEEDHPEQLITSSDINEEPLVIENKRQSKAL